MTQNTKTPDTPGASRAPRSPGRRPSLQLISDGVVAGYIHEISQRQRDWRQRTERRRADEKRRRRPWLLEGAASST